MVLRDLLRSLSRDRRRTAFVLLSLIFVSIWASNVWSATGTKTRLGDRVMAGVQIKADLVNIANPTYVAMGMGKTHRLEVRLSSLSKKRALKRGLVALKLRSPDGRFSEPLQLLLEEGRFTTDLSLLEKGVYELIVGCRVYDGRKRQFSFNYTVR